MKVAKKNRSPIPEPDSVDWGIAAESVGHLVRRIHMRSQAIYGEVMAPLALTSFHLGVLEFAARNEFLTQRRLADLILVDPSIIVGAVDELEARGLIARRRAENDRRAFLLETTPDGLKMLKKAREACGEAEARLTEKLSPEQRAQVLDLLRRIAGI